MFFDLDEDQQQLRSILRSFLDAECPTQGLVKRTGQRINTGADMALFQRFGEELGLIGAAVPTDRGGSGFGLAGLFVIFRELGRAVYGGPFLSSVLAAETLVHADLDGDEDGLLQGLLSGQHSATVAGLGWERTDDLVAREQAGQWTVTGRVAAVLDAEAGAILVFANAPDGLGCFRVIDRSYVGVEPVQLLDLSRSAADLAFDHVPVVRIGSAGAAARARDRVAQVAALCIAAEQVGVAERALEITIEHACMRKQFGVPIGSFQAIKHRCADVAMVLEGAVNTGQHAAWALDRGISPDQPWVSYAKSVCVEASVKATSCLIQVLGGLGFTWEHPAHIFYRRAVSSRYLFGSTDVHRQRIVASVVGHG